MRVYYRWVLALLVGLTTVASSLADDDQAPWGRASAGGGDYTPQKVVYDVAVADADAFGHVLDRVSYLNNLYRADPFRSSIVVVLHGDEIPLFAVKNLDDNEALMRRAQSLTVAGPIEFRICTQAARGHGLAPEDIHGFVTMVPMADAEIVKLQREESYAYMR